MAVGNRKLSASLLQMVSYCKLVILQLDDMKDLVLIIESKLVKKTCRFDVMRTIENLKQLMKLKASLKHVDL